ncbi:uncharacterized protein LOC129905050 [Solanum dulcamara]|uniref:uncharacterized protein LOC129905050 n=1 Tax=Solanum dulcamara TaxID=45834 RepID=UPI0024865364|nr:uncharacterized protein LOC129905050 [Solanum dulcamara]
MDRVKLIQQRLLTAQSRQKSYMDRCVHDVSLSIGERLLLKVSPTKGVMGFRRKRKLSLRFIGLFEVLEKYGEVAYKLDFSPRLSVVHPVFQVSRLKRYWHDDFHVIQLNLIALDQNLSFEEELVAILDRQTRLRSKHIDLVKVH